MSDFTKDDKDNILPILNKKAQLRIKKQIARELNAAKAKMNIMNFNIMTLLK